MSHCLASSIRQHAQLESTVETLRPLRSKKTRASSLSVRGCWRVTFLPTAAIQKRRPALNSRLPENGTETESGTFVAPARKAETHPVHRLPKTWRLVSGCRCKVRPLQSNRQQSRSQSPAKSCVRRPRFCPSGRRRSPLAPSKPHNLPGCWTESLHAKTDYRMWKLPPAVRTK